MKVTGNEVKVAKHSSVITPIVVVVSILLCSNDAHVHCYSIISARSPA